MAEREKQVVLEIGVGGHPFPVNPTMVESRDGRQLSRNFRGGLVYIGIDNVRDSNRYWDGIMAFLHGIESPEETPEVDKRLVLHNLALAQRKYLLEKPDENINFMVADAHNLPFAPESIDEVFFSNVFGSQLTDDSLKKILSDVSRVMKPNGKIVVRETGTPQWSWRDSLPALLGDYGFEVEEFVNYGNQRYEKLLDTYCATFEDVSTKPHPFREDMYFCIAKKI